MYECMPFSTCEVVELFVVNSKPANFMPLLVVARLSLSGFGVWCNETNVPISRGYV